MSTFRRVCRWLHRELGFLAVGLTLVYAVSGIAVNHIHHWDPSYRRTVERSAIAPPGTGPTAEVVPVVLSRLALADSVLDTWRARPELLQVFVEGAVYDVRLDTGEVVRRGSRPRPLLYDLNFMHLNRGKGPWTGIADAYAAVLAVLAITGIFLVRGRRGLAGRGGLLMAAGFLLPLLYALWVRGG